ncbi:low temperature requirement protein A [Merismopedia glauca]|uniref:Low temperature requirement protein A n=1 Tax=Merismopedia glauca CCAP 1448/3 TaxID=1296344 RepID=A0A2T1BXU2_9CYAN|nr:low temperature requirement protein A [Merismopedia glauca]PSB00744.1 low temperature requirement protein A [Merismopedia glauca CCAP 1448/3]
MKRTILQTTRLRQDSEGDTDRRATWLELFYDLIFVAAIGELAHSLSSHLNFPGLVDFIAFFVPIWWCWIGATFYATRFDNDSVSDRLSIFIQMAIVAAMAVNVHSGLQAAATNFAFCYAAFRGLMVLQYLNAGYCVPVARPLTQRFAVGFGLSVSLWALSIFVPSPWRFVLWGVGLIIDFGTPLIAGQLVTKLPPSVTHIPERVGLFTIIVLGEAIIAVVQGLSKLNLGFISIISAVIGLGLAFSLWWLYFNTADGSPIQAMRQGKKGIGLTWLYIHLPLVMSITAAGAAIQHLIAKGLTEVPTEMERWVFCGATALSLCCLAGIHWLTRTLGTLKFRTILSAYRLGSAVFLLIVAISGQSLSGFMLVVLVAAACGVQVVLDLLTSLWRSHPPLAQ